MQWDASPSANQGDLARFIIKQCKISAAVDIINKAKDELPTLSQSPEFDGYASGQRTKVHAQVEALYNALHKHRPELVGSIEPQDRFAGPVKQFVRTIREIIEQREADCIDIVCLFASLLLKVGLNPLVAIVGHPKSKMPTHSILGYWLEERLFQTVKIQWSAVTPNLEDIAFLEATGVLRGNKNPFVNASAQALISLPKDSRNNIPLRQQSKVYGTRFFSAPDIKVFYLIDVRRMLEDTTNRIPVISIMGSKGGVGKGSIASRMAALIAETKHNVLIIDFDIDSAGSTFFYSNHIQSALPQVKTVYDHLLPYSELLTTDNSCVDENLWKVTPPYLQERDLGKIYLIPATPYGVSGKFGVIANIDRKKRNDILKNEVDNIIKRAEAMEEIDCVIIDCGAGINPIYSAAFDRARYAFIVATPDPISFRNIEPVRTELLKDSPNVDIRKMRIIVNRVATEEQAKEAMISRWASFRPIGFVAEDPDYQLRYNMGSVSFDLGYDDFSLSIREILSRTLHGLDADLVPNEIDIRIAPWWNIVINRRLPQHVLKSTGFKIKTFFLRSALAITVLGVIFLGYLGFHTHFTPHSSSHLSRILIAFGFLFFLSSNIFTLIKLFRHEKLRTLLILVSKKGKDKKFIEDLLLRSHERAIKYGLLWIRNLLENGHYKDREIKQEIY